MARGCGMPPSAGCGLSATTGLASASPRPGQGRAVADTAADVRAICAELCIDNMGTWGFSGGGPHVLACAALLPDLVTAAATLASLAPFDAEGPDWITGMDRDDADFSQNSGSAPVRS